MIGDREHDVLAARELGLGSIGVTWGFGSEAELSAASADVIVHEVSELSDALLRSVIDRQSNIPSSPA
jgi:phosphoglycolate phosphatase